MKISAVFLDRDGVLNENSDDFVRNTEELIIFPFVPASVRKLNDAGIDCYIISNQSGIGRGYFPLEESVRMFEKILTTTLSYGGKIRDYFFCPHTPEEACICRKPQTGLFDKAVEKYGINRNETLFIGDSPADYYMAVNARIPFVLVRTGNGRITEELLRNEKREFTVCNDLAEAVDLIIRRYV